jgi:hypothetical protein
VTAWQQWAYIAASAWPLVVLILYLAFNFDYFATMLRTFLSFLVG